MFITDNGIDVTNQLVIDITKYRNSNEGNMQIIRHFYSEEWEAKYLKYTIYPKKRAYTLTGSPLS